MLHRTGLALAVFLAIIPACSSSKEAPDLAPACTLDVPAAPPGWSLHTDGAVLRDSLARIVVLRGVNAGARSKIAPYMPFEYDTTSPSDFTAKLNEYMDH